MSCDPFTRHPSLSLSREPFVWFSLMVGASVATTDVDSGAARVNSTGTPSIAGLLDLQENRVTTR